MWGGCLKITKAVGNESKQASAIFLIVLRNIVLHGLKSGTLKPVDLGIGRFEIFHRGAIV